jgi:hypothetical protein
MHSAFDSFLGLLGKRLNPQDETAFLLNNWDLTITVFQERGVGNHPSVVALEAKMRDAMTSFVEGQLQLHFSSLLHFVADAEARLARGEDPNSLKEPQMSVLVLWFKSNWRQETDRIKEYTQASDLRGNV